MAQFVISVIGGLATGSAYCLLSLGLVFAFRGTGIFNLAHGQLLLLAAYLVAEWSTTGVPFGLSVVAGILVVAFIGVLFYRLVLYRAVGLQPFIALIATLGLAAILDGITSLIFGGKSLQISASILPPGVLHIAGTGISEATLVLTAFSLCVALAIIIWSHRTETGTRLRAAGQNALLSSQGGINVRRFYMAAWALSAGLAAIAGITYGSTNLVSPTMVDLGFSALPAVMIGGIDSIDGALIGGLAIGLLQGFVATYAGGQLLDVTTYTVLLVVLLFRPQGLLGTKEVIRV
jgi:branched-chain amino acid transport system permease protein